MKQMLPVVAAMSLLSAVNLSFSTAHAQGTAFTYQGQLQNNGSPASGTYNLQFTLYTNAIGGMPAASPVTNNAVAVTNGLFTVTLDFGNSVWNGETNWLQIGVESNGGASFTTLSPLQELTPVPYAIFAESVGTVSASQLGSLGNSPGTFNDGNFFVGPSGTQSASGFDNTSIGDQAFVADTSGSQNTAEGYRALESNTSGSDNIANGYLALASNGSGSGNVANGVQALGSNSSGNNNTANGYQASFYNANGNYNTADGIDALYDNTAGNNNTAVGSFALENLGNDDGNATNNIALGYDAGSALLSSESSDIDIGNAGVQGESDVTRIGNPGIQTATYLAGTLYAAAATITNFTGTLNLANPVITAGVYTLLFESNYVGNVFIGQGAGNGAADKGVLNTANGSSALGNNTTGRNNTANGSSALGNNTTGGNNTANGEQALFDNMVGDGNTANGYQASFFNANGNYNTADGFDALFDNTAGNFNTAVGGFALENLGNDGGNATNNIALGYNAGSALLSSESSDIDIGNAGVQGESDVTRIGTPGIQTATYLAGSVGIATTAAGELLQIGSNTNQADGIIRLGCGNGTQYRTWDVGVPYGGANTSGTNYSFIIRDDSAGSTRFMIDYANGDVCIGTNTALGLLTVGTAYCTGTTWQNGSDRNSKKDFSAVNPEEVLAKVASLPITQWQYKVEGAGIEHLGPMAQDFHTAFGLNGSDDKHISTVDEGGVALAAIQGLNQKLEEQAKEKDTEITDLKEELNELKTEVQSLKDRN